MSFQGLVELMDTLRGEKGCPWDKKQTLDSLKPFLIEEAYEVIEAMEQNEPEKLKEELGDLLFHILFVSKVCSDMGKFSIEDVIRFESEKMRRRHPHVFAQKAPSAHSSEEAPDGASAGGAAEVLKNWYEMKREERTREEGTSLMNGVPLALPALQKAQKVQRRAAHVGFDWEKPEGVLDKISEEVQELREAVSRSGMGGSPKEEDSPGHAGEELGDILFSVVNLCRFLKVDAEGALRGTIARFTKRFRAMEERAAASGRTLDALSLEQMDALWEEVKAEEQENQGQ